MPWILFISLVSALIKSRTHRARARVLALFSSNPPKQAGRVPATSLGAFALKGVGSDQEIFVPAGSAV